MALLISEQGANHILYSEKIVFFEPPPHAM